MSKEKRRLGDRKDGKLLRKLDSMHIIMPLIYPNRCDNEAFISERIDLTSIDRYLEKRNSENPEFKFTIFHIIVAAMLKIIILRPKFNRFIANKNMYQRNDTSASFIVKKQFGDDSEEGLALIKAKPESTLDSLHDQLYRQISHVRGGNKGSTDESMDLFCKLPRFLLKLAVGFVRWLDRHGWVPKSFIADDPYYASVILSNLGSIKLKSGYHHLTNWGTTSLFVVVGEKKMRPFYTDNEGSYDMRDSIELGLTIDERLADGYYYSKSVRMLKYILEHPECLEEPLSTPVDC